VTYPGGKIQRKVLIVMGNLPKCRKQRNGLIDALSPRWELKEALKREMRARIHA
jgi:hypothetical protein